MMQVCFSTGRDFWLVCLKDGNPGKCFKIALAGTFFLKTVVQF